MRIKFLKGIYIILELPTTYPLNVLHVHKESKYRMRWQFYFIIINLFSMKEIINLIVLLLVEGEDTKNFLSKEITVTQGIAIK